MNRVSSQLKMHYVNSKKSFIIFWSIMLAISVLGILVSVYVRSRGYDGIIIKNNIIAVVIFAAVSGLVSYVETLPYLLNVGITRKSFVLGFIVYNTVLSVVLSAVFVLLTLLESLAYKLLGFTNLQMTLFFTTFSITEILVTFLLYFAIILAITALFTLMGSIYYKKDGMFLLGLGTLILLIMFIPGVAAKILTIMEYLVLSLFGEKNYLPLILFSIGLFVICYLIIYPLARTSQIRR